MPKRLRPKVQLAPDAILVGDPGRSLLLAQELLEEPKMSNHARGLWGYSGRTPAGQPLTIQATGMGGPSAALVLADLAKLGVKRAVRVGTCVAIDDRARLGELLLPAEAIAAGGSAATFGLSAGERVRPDTRLLDLLRGELAGQAREAAVESFDTMPTRRSHPRRTPSSPTCRRSLSSPAHASSGSRPPPSSSSANDTRRRSMTSDSRPRQNEPDGPRQGPIPLG